MGADSCLKDTIVQSITGFYKTRFTFGLFGCPLFRGRLTSKLFSTILEKIQHKLSGWKGKILSSGAKLTHIKPVLQAMPQYLLALVQPTKATLNVICNLMSDLFWHVAHGQHKLH